MGSSTTSLSSLSTSCCGQYCCNDKKKHFEISIKTAEISEPQDSIERLLSRNYISKDGITFKGQMKLCKKDGAKDEWV